MHYISLKTYIVCPPPWDKGGGTIFGKISSRRGNIIFEEAGGTTSGGGKQISKSPGGGIEQKSKINQWNREF